MAGSLNPLFAPVRIGGISLRNRLAVAPMTRVSATADGHATRRMAQYYASFAAGGFGLLISEGIYTDRAYSQGYLFQPGLADAAQRDAWRPVVASVHASGARIFAQLMHAGALSQGNPHRSESRGPSAVRPKGQQMSRYRGSGQYRLPSAMSEAEIAEAVNGFASAAVLAQEAGFDGVELHGANGYLLDQFLTEGINLRDDIYGGTIECRVRLLVETVQVVRRAIGPDFIVGVRISQSKVNDFAYKWRGGDRDAAAIFGALRGLPIDYIHTTELEAWRPAFGEGPTLAALAKRHVAIPVIANGSLHDPKQASALLERGEADLVSLGRGALTHADWPRRLAAGEPMRTFDPRVLEPIADLEHADRHQVDCCSLATALGSSSQAQR